MCFDSVFSVDHTNLMIKRIIVYYILPYLQWHQKVQQSQLQYFMSCSTVQSVTTNFYLIVFWVCCYNSYDTLSWMTGNSLMISRDLGSNWPTFLSSLATVLQVMFFSALHGRGLLRWIIKQIVVKIVSSQTLLSAACLYFQGVFPPLSISQFVYANESLYGSICASGCVFLQVPHPSLSLTLTTINALSLPHSLSNSLSHSLSDIHSNDPCLSHPGTMLWIPSKQKNKWRLLCKWICGGPCAKKKKWVVCILMCMLGASKRRKSRE